MFAVIFEVRPDPRRGEAYLGLAARLRPALERVDGFVDNLRYLSLTRPGWLLSLSTWRDEKSLVRWRTCPVHHGAQAQGRALDWIDLGHLAIDVRAQGFVECVDVLLHPVQQILEVFEVGNFHVLLVAELIDDARDRIAADLPGIDRLQRATARTRACGGIDAGRVRLHDVNAFDTGMECRFKGSPQLALSRTRERVQAPVVVH